MNVFNRAVLVVLCLILIGGAVAATVLAWAAPNDSIDWLRDAATWLEDRNTDGTKALITIGAVITGMVALTVLVIELYPRSGTQVQVTDVVVGDAVLSTAAVGQRIEEAVTQVPHVSDVRAEVKAKRKGVLLSLDLHVDPEANLATVTDDACEAARNVLADKVHVALLEPPRARIHYRELRLKGRKTGRAAPAVAQAQDTPAEPEPAREAPAEKPDASAQEKAQQEQTQEEEEKPVNA